MTRTYPVADLVLPPPNGDVADYSLATLKQLITDTIEPDQWTDAGGAAAIRSHEPTLSLIVNAEQATHEKIVDVILQLRDLRRHQVAVTPMFLDRVPPRLLTELGLSDTTPERKLVLDAAQRTELVDACQNAEQTNLYVWSAQLMYNGQRTELKSGGHSSGVSFQPIISPDRKFVCLQVEIRDPRGASEDSANCFQTVADQQTLLIKVERPAWADSPEDSPDGAEDGGTWLLLTPRIVDTTEEEELLGIDIGEEEELLGIDIGE